MKDKNFFNTKEELAKYTIEHYLKNNKAPEISEEDVKEDLKKKASCFVTVYIDGNLRGCIGDIESNEPLYKNIIRRSVSAVSSDFRFSPISIEEFPKMKVEVSVLSPISEYRRENNGKLIAMLIEKKPGLILENEGRKALFLPQVWEDLSDPVNFLERLSLKAGLDSDQWKENSTKFWVFTVEK